MSFIRPEAKDFLMKWREAIIGGAVLMFNIQLAYSSGGLLRGIALAGILIGAFLYRRFNPASGVCFTLEMVSSGKSTGCAPCS